MFFIVFLLLLPSMATAQLTLAQLQLTELQCQALRASSVAAVPCECRLPVSQLPLACHPDCCPRSVTFAGDRCHPQNARDWTPYEQRVCRPPTTTQDFSFDGVCFTSDGRPQSVSATNNIGGTFTTIGFRLSLKLDHRCDDLFLTSCSSTSSKASDLLVDTISSKSCWITCPPQSVSGCTSDVCWAHRGRTLPLLKRWDLDRTLTTGNLYALVCQTLVAINSGLVNQTQYHAAAFLAP